MTAEAGLRRGSARLALLVLASVVLAGAYWAMPDNRVDRAPVPRDPEDERDPQRIEILEVSPRDPYRGSTLAIVHSPAREGLAVYAGKLELPVLARRVDGNVGELVAELPRDVAPGDLKLRLASRESGSFATRALHSKPYHVRVREPDYRKIFRNLVGGAALVLLGIYFLARGVRASTGVAAARFLSRFSQRRSVVMTLGAALGAVAQSTTGAAGVLAGLVSAGVLARIPAALAFLAAPLGAALVPLGAAGLVEPREGLVLVAIGVLWLKFAEDRRGHAYARLLLGVGFVAFGLQTARPALEPFLSDGLLWSLNDPARTLTFGERALCASFGGLAVAALHGPAPLIVLSLGVAQATGTFSLPTLLALLSGTAFGASLAAMITAPANPAARALARLHLGLGALASLLAFLSLDVWVALSERVIGALDLPLHWSTRMPMSELGVRLFVGFGSSQLAVTALLSLLLPAVLPRLHGEQRGTARGSGAAISELRVALERVLAHQQLALNEVVHLTLTGARKHGDAAERALTMGRRELDQVLAERVRAAASDDATHTVMGVSFATLQLQNALVSLLETSQRLVDARLERESRRPETAVISRAHEALLESVHRLISDGLDAARRSLREQELLDMEAARAREIQLNLLEAEARAAMFDAERPAPLAQGDLHVLEVVGAYEVSGNHLYRLAEILGQGSRIPRMASTT